MKFHVITGLPRSGSTLLCNILSQNPKFKVTSTSPINGLVNLIIHSWSSNQEIKAMLGKDKDIKTKMENSLRAFVENWEGEKDKIIFDKSRGWSHNSLVLHSLFPEAKIICTIRDLRNIFASIEKQHKKNPLFDDAQNPNAKTIYARADQMFSQENLIGLPLVGIADLIRRNPKGLMFVKYEDLASNPESTMRKVYELLEEPYFKHNFKNVKNVSNEPDEIWNGKFPHEGNGEVKMKPLDEWKEHLSEDLANTIMQKFTDYNKYFGY